MHPMLHSSRVIVLVTASAVLSSFASAQLAPSHVPVSLGPLGGSASSVVADPLNPNVILVIKYTKGLFRSTDGGKTFDAFGTGAPALISDLVRDPSNPSRLYAHAGTQIFRSPDFGATWSPLPFNSIEDLKCVSVSATGSDLMATDAFNVYRMDSSGLHAGVTFAVVPFAGEVIEDVIHAPSNPAIVYCTSTKGVYKSINGGQSFSDPGPFSLWAQAITVHPTNPDIVFAGTPFNGVHRSLNGAATFDPVGTGLAATGNAEFFAWSPDGSTLWYALLTGVVKTTTLGASWDDANAGLPTSNPPIPLALGTDSLGNVFLGTEGGGLNDSAGGGLYWRPAGTNTWTHI